MEIRFSVYTVLLVVAGFVNNASAASYVTKCKADDSKCIKSASKAAVPLFAVGIPELKIEGLDPLYYESLDASSAQLKLLLNGITVTGLSQCEIKRVERDAAKSKLYVRVLCNIVLDGHYEIDGRILILPIQGNGKAHVELNKLLVNVECDLIEKVKKDVSYWNIKRWNHSFELKDKSVVELENLFGGREDLAGAVQSLLKTSSNEIVGEVGPPIVKSLVSKVVETINRFFNKVPASELTLDV